ncbi:glycosyl transferase family 2 [Thermodesulfitimonas autotrophica]|uniref:Glycosyl transferase family 2 n=1 Tax=Thermodesulfitimonas autotrophica TaxID=1894989 RepID=A0A3N5B057_9THEO|nr:glycosyltransferase [Thermodesulfitimonas autotrophica]RPF42848.1 glycosyl transferase family 2 [Thermodesulfitimonas autotrophica]
MTEIAHTLLFLVRDKDDLAMADLCLGSLARSAPGALVVFYNQGLLTNEALRSFANRYNLRAEILGRGENVGIAAGRTACFEHVWANFPEVAFISELHVDMAFPMGWVSPLLAFLKRTGEPMVCPGILTREGELHPEGKGKKVVPVVPLYDLAALCRLLATLTEERVVAGFVHPVVHRSVALREVGGYDLRFLKGKQGFEDDALLLGYRYYMGTKSGWRPKCLLSVRVFHATLFQRMFLPDKELEFNRNLSGLITQYGIKGLLELGRIHGEESSFGALAAEMMRRLSGGQSGR